APRGNHGTSAHGALSSGGDSDTNRECDVRKAPGLTFPGFPSFLLLPSTTFLRLVLRCRTLRPGVLRRIERLDCMRLRNRAVRVTELKHAGRHVRIHGRT